MRAARRCCTSDSRSCSALRGRSAASCCSSRWGCCSSPRNPGRCSRAAGDQFWWMIGRDVASWIFTTFPFGVVVYLCVAGIAHAIHYFVEATRARGSAGARLGAAGRRPARRPCRRSSIRTSCSTASTPSPCSFATATAPRRRSVIEQLSDVLRSTLSRTQANEVTLDEELQLVRQYLAVEQARFSDRLRPVLRRRRRPPFAPPSRDSRCSTWSRMRSGTASHVAVMPADSPSRRSGTATCWSCR